MNSRTRRLGLTLLLGGTGLIAACGGEAPQQEGAVGEPVQPATVSEPPSTDTMPGLHRFLPDEMRRSTRAETFPHDAHVRIDCSVCHNVPRGHGTHQDVECAACHRASAQATQRNLTPADCQTCHHVTQQTWTCEHCHGTPGTYVTRQQFALGVWSAPRTRELTFQHGWHEGLDCSSCHRTEPSLSPEPCSSCHAEHHAQGVRCQSCHAPSPISRHDVNAHLSCSGAGCHNAPFVEAIADTRTVCLVCHQAQENHEPGGQCIQCHAVRPRADGGRR